MRNKFFKTLAVVSVAALTGIAACGDDDDPEDGNGGGNGGGGTPGNIISGDVTDLDNGGSWGGVVLSGFGITSEGSEVSTEAAPANAARFYGGSNNDDSSGSLEYVIIAESGFVFGPDAEVQGLTVEAAGSGTTIDFVQILASEDDCVEWFGGAADASHVICNGVEDDGLDIDEGYVGNIQFAIVRIGTENGNYGIESDGKLLQTPFTAPNIANVTVLGNIGLTDPESDASIGALHRENFQGKVYRSVYTDDILAGGAFDSGCLEIRDDDTIQANGGTDGDDAVGYFDVIFNCGGGTADGLTPPDTDGDGIQQQGFDDGLIDTVMASGVDVTSTLAVTGTFTPATPGTALPAGFEEADYYGAVDPSVADGSAWWQGWTYINSGVDGGLPGADFHPLQAEIEDGTISPAVDNACSSLNSDFADGGTVTVFGQTFPVCVISGDITTDTTLVNNHVFVLSDFVNIGDGDAAESTEGSVANVTLTIPAGTQIYAAEGSAISLTATRGSRLVAQGTAELPILFSAVELSN